MKRLSFSIESFGSFANELKCARAYPGLFCLVCLCLRTVPYCFVFALWFRIRKCKIPSVILCPPESFEIPYIIEMAFSIYAKKRNTGILTEMASTLLIGCYTRPVLILLACDSIYMSFQIIFINIL